ncbi:MAG TPA: hypothetical protein VFZ01_14235 [Geminicoccaceae bacterium]
MRARLRFGIMVLGCVWLAPTGARAEGIALRAGEHPGFGRIVLEWPEPVTVEASGDRGALTLTFGRRVDEVDFSPALERLPDHLLGFAPGEGLEQVVLQVDPDVRPKVWSTDRRTIIDLYRPVLDPPPVPVWVNEAEGVTRLLFDWPEPVSFRLHDENGTVTMHFDGVGQIDPLAVADALGGLVRSARANTGREASQLELDLRGPVELTGRAVDSRRIQVDFAPR